MRRRRKVVMRSDSFTDGYVGSELQSVHGTAKSVQKCHQSGQDELRVKTSHRSAHSLTRRAYIQLHTSHAKPS